MASAPQNPLPLFYQDLMPLNSRDHATWRARPLDKANFFADQHAIPLTVEEFPQAQHDMPIVFSSGDNAVPLALMGLNEGVNVFVGPDGKMTENVYLPAYIRRYPYLLAKLTPETEELSLCFDPTAEALGDYEDGEALFDAEGNPSQQVQNALQFCDQFEQAGTRTQQFIDEIMKHDLLMDGEVGIARNDDPEKPYIYRGFRMINEDKLRQLDAETVKMWNENGMLGLIYAHLFSMDMMRVIFGKQMELGKVPEQVPAA